MYLPELDAEVSLVVQFLDLFAGVFEFDVLTPLGDKAVVSRRRVVYCELVFAYFRYSTQ